MSRTFRIDPAGARLESGLIDRSFSSTIPFIMIPIYSPTLSK